MFGGASPASFSPGFLANNYQQVNPRAGAGVTNFHPNNTQVSSDQQVPQPQNPGIQNRHQPHQFSPASLAGSVPTMTHGMASGSPVLTAASNASSSRTPGLVLPHSSVSTSTPLTGGPQGGNLPTRPVIMSPPSSHGGNQPDHPAGGRYSGGPPGGGVIFQQTTVSHPGDVTPAVASAVPNLTSQPYLYNTTSAQIQMSSHPVSTSTQHHTAATLQPNLLPVQHQQNLLPVQHNVLQNRAGGTSSSSSRRSVSAESGGSSEWEVKVVVRSSSTTSKEADRRQVVTVLLQERVSPVHHNKEVYVQLTDRQDPLLFYSLCITEEDFQNVKASQGLLVDFASFPGMLRQLLDKCEAEGDSASPSFILVFKVDTGTTSSLDFTELNMFKHLCHLSLVVVKATDAKLKEYLVGCIQQLKSDLSQTSQQLSASQQDLTEKQAQLDSHTQQLEAVKKEQQETSSSMGRKLVSDLQQEKEQCSKKINDLQSRFEDERRELESRHSRSMDQLENRVASLDVQNRDLLEGKYRNEANIRELRGKLAAREEEFKRLEADFHALSRDKGLTDVRSRDEARRVAELQDQLSSLQVEVRDKDQQVTRAREEVARVDREKEELVAELKEKANTVTRRESAVRSVTEELVKANEIIRKLQDQVKQEQNKSRLRGKIAAEQEKLLTDKDKDLQQVTHNLRKAELATETAAKEKSEEVSRVKQLEVEKEELEKLNKSNENVINWLNKQLASFKSADANIGPSARGGVSARGGGRTGRPGVTTRKSTSDVNTDNSKENEPLVGLDPKYFEVCTPGGTLTRNEIPDVRQLPSNIKRNGGLLRR